MTDIAAARALADWLHNALAADPVLRFTNRTLELAQFRKMEATITELANALEAAQRQVAAAETELVILRRPAVELILSHAQSDPTSAKTHLNTAVARAKDWYKWRATHAQPAPDDGAAT